MKLAIVLNLAFAFALGIFMLAGCATSDRPDPRTLRNGALTAGSSHNDFESHRTREHRSCDHNSCETR
jgi:hypothetical protein